MVTATAIIPAPSRAASTRRSLTATALAGAALALPARALGTRRLTVIASMTPSTISRAIPTATGSPCSGPSHRGAVTSPCSPASPTMISAATGSTGGVVPGWRLVIASRSWCDGWLATVMYRCMVGKVVPTWANHTVAG